MFFSTRHILRFIFLLTLWRHEFLKGAIFSQNFSTFCLNNKKKSKSLFWKYNNYKWVFCLMKFHHLIEICEKSQTQLKKINQKDSFLLLLFHIFALHLKENDSYAWFDEMLLTNQFWVNCISSLIKDILLIRRLIWSLNPISVAILMLTYQLFGSH